MSSEAISTLRLSRWVRRRASFAVVVVLPEPCRPTIMIATGGTALRSMVWPSEPEGGDQLVMDDLDHHLAGSDRLDDGGTDRLFADAIGKASDDVERDVGFEQRAAHLAHRGVDIGLRERTAPRQPIENATKLFRQIVEQCRCPLFSERPLAGERPDAFADANTFAPEGASRCRALASGLMGRAAGRKERLSEKVRGLNPRRPGKSRKVGPQGVAF